jgi:hypothetical protein
MPVRKYRSVDEMPPAGRREAGDQSNLRIACELSMTASRAGTATLPVWGVSLSLC